MMTSMDDSVIRSLVFKHMFIDVIERKKKIFRSVVFNLKTAIFKRLTQNGKMNATDKYRITKEINVLQPAIVLLNPEDAGSLLTEPSTLKEQQTAMYWKERAFIYVMEQYEYFYKRPQPHHHQAAATADEHLSGSSSMGTNDARLGELDEFDRMIHRYQQKHHS